MRKTPNQTLDGPEARFKYLLTFHARQLPVGCADVYQDHEERSEAIK